MTAETFPTGNFSEEGNYVLCGVECMFDLIVDDI